MFKVKIFSIHKTKERWLNDAIAEYKKRLSANITIEFVICKDNSDMEKKILKEKFYICLDEKGQNPTSTELSKSLFGFFSKNDCKISFIIGGETGLSKAVKNKAGFILSLSPLTFTHHMIRLILIEQLYRAYEISKNSRYHK